MVELESTENIPVEEVMLVANTITVSSLIDFIRVISERLV